MVMTTVTAMVKETKNNDIMEHGYTDLHTHILPAMDDGARDFDAAWEMLRAEKRNGVERVALTPHFYPQKTSPADFLAQRQQAYEALLPGYDGETMPQLRLGAEVRYTPLLTEMDLRELTLGNSDYLLLELPDRQIPTYVEQVVEVMRGQGITPILAHIDRCLYFQAEPHRLEKLIQVGALAQIDESAFRNRKAGAFANACFRSGLAHILASDAHDLTDRAPGLGGLTADRNVKLLEWAESFALAVWENTPPPAFGIHSLKNGLFGYR